MNFDQISDMLTSIRNAQIIGKSDILVQASKIKLEVVKKMNQANYIGDVSIQQEGNKKFLKIKLKYDKTNKAVISGIKRISKLGKRVYKGKKDIPKVKNGYGMAIISTSKGVMNDIEAREAGVGGEVICEIW